MYYAIEISDTNNYGVYATDKNGNKLTDTTKLTGSFKIVVPPIPESKKIIGLLSICITIKNYIITILFLL